MGGQPMAQFITRIALKVPRRFQNYVYRFLYQLPGTIAVWMVWLGLFLGFYFDNCNLYTASFSFFTFIVFLSFMHFGEITDLVKMSPWLRQIQQLLMFTYRGDSPPPMLYVT